MTELRTTIAAHPWAAIGCAFVVGGCLAVTPRTPTARAIRATVASIVVVSVREILTRRLTIAARAWLERSERSERPAATA